MTIDEGLILENNEFDVNKDVGPHKEEIEQHIENNDREALMEVKKIFIFNNLYHILTIEKQQSLTHAVDHSTHADATLVSKYLLHLIE
jgi:hypothetical protein